MLKAITGALALCLALAAPAGLSAHHGEGRVVAIFAGGCFWCMEEAFDQVEGVISTTSGYIGGDVANPTYRQVSSGNTGHAEAVQIAYDPAQVDYERLLEVFWRNVDPFDAGGQFCDRGSQYRSGVFYHGAEQQRLAEQSKAAVAEELSQPIATEITEAGEFYPAEDYHQDYYTKNPLRYQFYKTACGRKARLDEVWAAAGS